MKKYKYFTLFICCIIALVSCSKADNDSSLFEPAFEHKYLKSISLNGTRWIEVEYSGANKKEISSIFYYDENGNLVPGSTETVAYKYGKIVEKTDGSFNWQYSYNAKNNLEKIIETYKPTGDLCTYQYLYNDTLRNLPVGLRLTCTNSYAEETIYDYKNLNNRSYISFTTNNQNNNRSIIQKTKFIDNFINPLHELNPDIFDYYMDNIYQDFSRNELYEYTIESNSGHYPLEVTESKLDPKTLSVIFTNTYTYEYVK